MILIDTAPLVALCDTRDSQHRRALRQFERLAIEDLGTCEAVVMEACFHLPYSFQRQRLQAVLDDFHVAPLSAPADAGGFWRAVFDWLLKYAEHEPDWADACIAVLSGRDSHLKVWTYDREFRTVWRRPDGTAIPLAVR